MCLSLNLIQNKAFSQERYLIVLDIQDFPKKDKIQDSTVRDMILNVNSLISHFDTEKVIYIKAAGNALNVTFKGISVVTLPAPEFDSTLQVVNSNTFFKTKGDAFTSTEFISFIESKKVTEFVLVGLMAERCLYDTALGGKERGYDITVVPEGIVGTTPKDKVKAILKMKNKGIEFVPLVEIMNTL